MLIMANLSSLKSSHSRLNFIIRALMSYSEYHLMLNIVLVSFITQKLSVGCKIVVVTKIHYFILAYHYPTSMDDQLCVHEDD